MPKYNDFELDIQEIKVKEESYLVTTRTESMRGVTCPECPPYKTIEGCWR